MSRGRFWARSRTRCQETENAAAAAPARTRLLTTADRCDRCGARAYVRVLLPRGLELLFCGHHNRQYASTLARVAADIQDETGQLTHVHHRHEVDGGPQAAGAGFQQAD